MNILGINAYLHSSSVCLMKNGIVKGSVEEERLTRVKYTADFPFHSLNWSLDNNNMKIEDIDIIGFAWNPYKEIVHSGIHFLKYFPKTLNAFKPGTTDTPILPRIMRCINLEREIQRLYPSYNKKTKMMYLDHHLTHSATAYYSSPYDDAAILVMDGLGDNYDSLSIWVGTGNKIRKIKSVKFPHSLGTYYLSFVTHLGFKETSGPGKVMGLSSYGTDKYMTDFADCIKYKGNATYKVNTSKTLYHVYGRNKPISTELEKVIGHKRLPNEEVNQRHADIAYALQKKLEEVILEIIKDVKTLTGKDKLCIGGGVALNSVANGMIKSSGVFDEVFVCSAPDDSGTSQGAAQYLSHHILDLPRSNEHYSKLAYKGPSYTRSQVEKCIDLFKDRIKYTKSENIYLDTADLISLGKIVGWFQDEMEFGPRALGSRSILGDPRNPKMKDILNKKVKFRENFRPFAPAVLEEHLSEYFVTQVDSPFMSFVTKVKPKNQNKIPSGVHVDDTSRLQTVSDKTNLKFRKVIEAFYEKTGIPMVINTSFNINNEPIVCSPADAIECLLKTGMDYLVIDDFIVQKA